MLEFAVDLGWNCFAKEMYNTLLYETMQLLYWLCFAKGGVCVCGGGGGGGYSLRLRPSVNVNVKCFAKGCVPIWQNVCCVPLLHCFAVNFHNNLNCLENGISKRGHIQCHMKFDGRNFDRNWSVYFSTVKFGNFRYGCPPGDHKCTVQQKCPVGFEVEF